jgi:hypothetical protein
MPIIVFAAALGGAALLSFLAERGARIESAEPARSEDSGLLTLQRDPDTGEWRL